jgi:hypothetical protein
MRRRERVRWYLIGLGNENDIHTADWHGNTVLHRVSRTDTVELFPATTEAVNMRPDNVGTWLFHCHVTDHMAGGMMTRYRSLNKDWGGPGACDLQISLGDGWIGSIALVLSCRRYDPVSG